MLETIDYVHGGSFVRTQLRIVTDYPILPRACLPQLVAVLAAAQRKAVLAAVTTGTAFGLSAPEAQVTDLFVSERSSASGNVERYRGMHSNEYLYRCGSGQSTEETWVIAANHNETAWSRCQGRVWLDLDSARARTDATDRSAEVGGIFFDLSVGQCGEDLAKIRSYRANADLGEEVIKFSQYVSSLHIACRLVWGFGSFSVVGRGERSSMVELAPGVQTVELLGHVVVRAGESLTIRGDASSPVSLSLGQWQFQVEAGGSLELLGVAVVDASGSSAMAIWGEVTATNCTFARCVSGPNLLMRYAEGATLEGSEEHPPVHGVYLSASGAVAFVALSSAAFTARGCTFADNKVRGSRLANAGGGISMLGGRVVLSGGTSMRNNVAERGGLVARGGAINCIYAHLDVNDVEFTDNEANGGNVLGIASDAHVGRAVDVPSQTVRGGAIDLANCRGTISSSLFKGNKVRDASLRAVAGALAVGEATAFEVRTCSFVGNEAARGAQITSGGAVRVDFGGLLRLAETSFEGNSVTSVALAFGGAVYAEGSLILEGGVVFRANTASGDVQAGGGAVAMQAATSSLNASGLPGPTFVGNTVRLACATRSTI